MTERELALAEALDQAIVYIEAIVGNNESPTLQHLIREYERLTA